MPRFSTPTGTQDILPDEWPYWDLVQSQIEETARLYGYRRIETPTLGETSLFARTTGEGTDIVDKEMYSFRDRDGDDLTLRPEGTAPVVRAYLQHGMNTLPQPVKLFYIEHYFRRERPQRGRFREFHQFGCEAIGLEDAYLDVELIALLDQLFHRLGLHDLSVHLNSIGDSRCRPAYVELLVTYLERHRSSLAERDRERLERNPLRVLDTKEERSMDVVQEAPSILDHLCDDCRMHWHRVRAGLDLLGISYQIDPRLVRGLDYYTRTVFEFIPERGGQQSTVAAGGRYDGLAEVLGGPHTPGVGFGSGMERIIIELKARGAEVPSNGRPHAYVVHIGQGTEDAALRLVQRLRQTGVPAEMTFGQRSLKAQMKHAGNAGARYTVIVGEDELQRGLVTLRDLAQSDQREVDLDALIDELTES